MLAYFPADHEFKSDNYIKASPACKRAVLETVEALSNAGHDCVEFELPDGAIGNFHVVISGEG